MDFFVPQIYENMSLSTFVLVRHITNLSDARYCAGMGVNVLAFSLDKTSEHYTDPVAFKEITEWIAGIEFAGEYHDTSVEEIKLSLGDYPVDYMIVSNIDLIEELLSFEKKIIYRIAINDEREMNELSKSIAYLSDTVSYVIVQCNNPALFSEITKTVSSIDGVPVIRSFGNTVETVSHLDHWSGIVLEGSEEKQPGLKDFGEIMDILEVLEVD